MDTFLLKAAAVLSIPQRDPAGLPFIVMCAGDASVLYPKGTNTDAADRRGPLDLYQLSVKARLRRQLPQNSRETRVTFGCRFRRVQIVMDLYYATSVACCTYP